MSVLSSQLSDSKRPSLVLSHEAMLERANQIAQRTDSPAAVGGITVPEDAPETHARRILAEAPAWRRIQPPPAKPAVYES
jgi:hypothetical protein